MKELLGKMSVEQKIAQLTQVPPSIYSDKGVITGPGEIDGFPKALFENAGSTLGLLTPEEMYRVQKEHLERNELKIPLLFMNDVIHGHSTTYPIPLALAATFSETVAEEVASISAKESYYAGTHVTFSPMADLSNDSRWGRIMESFGEDPYLVSKLSAAFVKGYQGDDFTKEEKIISCVKHFAGYGQGQAGRDYNFVDMSERILREYHLPAYQAAIDAGAYFVMPSFNTINSIPSAGNKWLLDDLLRGEMGFDGIIITDWNGTGELISNHICETQKEAAKMSFEAGVDIEMCSTAYFSSLAEVIEGNAELEAQLDQRVLKVLELKEKLGLFENPYRGIDVEKFNTVTNSEESLQHAKDVAAKSIVLLQNDGCLPLAKDASIAVIGPNALNVDLNGFWSCNPREGVNISLVEALSQYTNVKYIQAPYIMGTLNNFDNIIYCGGERENFSGEGKSMADIALAKAQAIEVEEISKLNKNLIFLNYSGRAIDLSAINTKVSAIVQTWFLGSQTSQAIAEILMGIKSPSGKLPISFPRATGQLPFSYNEFWTGRRAEGTYAFYSSSYIDNINEPLYVFGHGLTYGNAILTYNSVEVINDEVHIDVNIKNDSNVDIEETVQVYITDCYASVVRPIKELKHFEKITLAANQEVGKKIILPMKALAFIDGENKFVVEAGNFEIGVGFDSKNYEKREIRIEEKYELCNTK